MPERRALSIELAAQRWCLLGYCRYLCDRPATGEDYKIVGMQWRLTTISGPRLNKSAVSATVVNVGCIPHPGVLSTLREPLQLGPASICTSGVGPSRERWREGRV